MKIGIVGGGLSGTLAAINLIKQGKDGLIIYLFEKKTDNLLRGVAYHKDNRYLPLNVPVKKMSLFSEQPTHFYDWLQANQHKYADALPDVSMDAFVSRGVYGYYVEDTFQAVLLENRSSVGLVITHDEVLAVQPTGNGFTVVTQNGGTLDLDKVLLALGNFPPVDVWQSNPAFYDASNPHYVALPWGAKAFGAVNANDDVLVIGAGLTMVDLLLCFDRKKHQGKVFTLSRNGLLPRPHGQAPELKLQLDTAQPTNYNYFQQVKSAIATANNNGANWRSVMDGLRQQTPYLWQSLSVAEKKTFMRRFRALWDVHRHRIPTASHQLIERMEAEGRFHSYAGKLMSLDVVNDRVEVRYKEKGETEERLLVVDKVINCTGPHPDFSKSPSTLIQQLLKDGLAVVDDLKIGLKTDFQGALLDRSGQKTNLYTIGPMRKGAWWESVALNEIRMQAEALPKLMTD